MKFTHTFSGKILTGSLLAVLILTASCGGGKEEKAEEEKKEEPKEIPVKKAGDLKIAYIDMDTLNVHYKLVKLRSDELAVEEERVQRELAALQNGIISEQKRLEKEFQYLPLSDQKAAEEKFMKMNQNYQKKEEALMGALQKKQAEMLQQMHNILTEYLSKYAKENGYDLILKQSAQLQMFYMDPQYDITKEVLVGLNEEFDKANKK